MQSTKEIIAKIATSPKKIDGRKNNGGKRDKKRGLSVTTVIKQMELAEVQTSIKNFARKILSAQAVAALGSWQIAILHRDANGKIGYARVRDEDEMIRLLEEGVHGKDYFVFTGEAPDWKAGADMLNRAGLKAKEDTEPKGVVNVFNLIHTSERQHGNNS